MVNTRAAMRAAIAVCVLALLGGCVSSSSGRTHTTPTPSSTVTIVDMGALVRTAAGNTVTVHTYESPVGAKPPSRTSIFAAADIEACASASNPTAVSRSLFVVETADKKVWPTVTDVKKPALRAALIPANRCVRGWVTFKVPMAKDALFVVLTSSTVAKWRIP